MLRRMSVGRILRETADQVVATAVAADITTLLGFPAPALLPLMVVGVGAELASSTADELTSAWQAERECRSAIRLQATVDCPTLLAAKVGSAGARLVDEMATHVGTLRRLLISISAALHESNSDLVRSMTDEVRATVDSPLNANHRLQTSLGNAGPVVHKTA
ncbi:MAG TPA: hypothetical protein VFX16_19020 [Pseudonocardiaceae bacterium]|nr:hypothetical protein [Pseudonocardiaceae bacterium]